MRRSGAGGLRGRPPPLHDRDMERTPRNRGQTIAGFSVGHEARLLPLRDVMTRDPREYMVHGGLTGAAELSGRLAATTDTPEAPKHEAGT